MTPRTDTQAAGQRQHHPAVSLLPAGHFARAGGVDLSAAEHQLLTDFRQVSPESRQALGEVVHKVAQRDRAERTKQNVAGLRLVGGGA
jgi:hypothetical protein